MNLFLLLTAMLSALAGVGRPAAARATAVEASRSVTVAQAVAPIVHRAVAMRPDGYVAPMPLRLDPGYAGRIVRAITPERRRE